MDAALKSAIKLLGGTNVVSSLFRISSQAVSQWDKTPHDRVLDLAKATGWRTTPHDLRPDLYPYPSDGLPPAIRRSAGTSLRHQAGDDHDRPPLSVNTNPRYEDASASARNPSCVALSEGG